MVSLIIPCYNSESYIERCLDSILVQNYKQIELILVNDGSVDDTEHKIDQMRTRIESNTERFIYIKQKNQGVGAACSAVFRQATGDYLMLLDSDDMLLPDSIKKCVEYLDTNQSYDLVRTNGYYVTEDNLYGKGQLLEVNPEMKVKTDIFEDVFCGRTYVWPGTYMIRMSVLDKLYPRHEIYPSRGGQNLQFLMMACYNRKAGFIDEPLMRYTVQRESLSHFSSGDVLQKEIQAMERYREIRHYLISEFMHDKEKHYWESRLNSLYANIYVLLACKHRNKTEAKKYFDILIQLEKPSLNTQIEYYRIMSPVRYVLMKIGRKIHLLR